MKKIVGILAAAALASSAFAEINVSSWGRMDFIPLNFAGEDSNGDKQVLSGAGANWDNAAGGKVGKDGVSFSGSTENAGMALDIAYAGTSLGVGDNANLWVKPFDMLKLTFGKVDYNNGRQELAYGTYGNSWRFQGLDQGEGGFSVDGRGVEGFVVNLNPIENLWFDYAASVKAAEAYRTLWDGASFGVGYNIPDVAKIRAIVIGKDGSYKDGDKYVKYQNEKGENLGCHAIIQAAADITPVEGLFLTVGASIPTSFGKAYQAGAAAGDPSYSLYTAETSTDDSITATSGAGTKTYYIKKTDGSKEGKTSQIEVIKASLGAAYTLNMLTFHGFFDSKIGVVSKYESTTVNGVTTNEWKNDGFGYAVGLGVDVAFTDSLSLITDVRFCNGAYVGAADFDTATVSGNTTTKDIIYSRGKFGAYVGLCQALTNGTFNVGVEMGTNKTIIQALDNSFTVAIPLQIQVGL